MTVLADLVTERNIRDFAGSSIYSRGLAYFRADRVQVKYADEQEAECIVRGTSYYTVSLWLHHGNDLGATCTCPYAANGWFCKHMVAAGLAVADHLEYYKDYLWQPRLDTLLEGFRKKPQKRSKPFWLFISLQRQSYGWKIHPYHLWIQQIPEGILPDEPSELVFQLPELVTHNQWMLEKIKSGKSYLKAGCINGGDDELSFADLIILQNKQNENRYYYYYQSDPYNLSFLLPLLAKAGLPLYLGDYRNPIRQHLHLFDKPVNLSLEMQRSDAGLQLRAALKNGDQVLDISATRAEILTDGPAPWVMAGEKIFRIKSDIDNENLSPWLQNSILEIPLIRKINF